MSREYTPEQIQHEIEDLRAWGYQQGAKGSTRMTDETSLRLMLDGFFHRFKLTPAASRLEFRRSPMSGEEYWLFTGLVPWWDEPGMPVVSQHDLATIATGKLRRLVQVVFRSAHAAGELDRVTFLRGGQQDDFCRALGIGV